MTGQAVWEARLNDGVLTWHLIEGDPTPAPPRDRGYSKRSGPVRVSRPANLFDYLREKQQPTG